MANRLLSPFAVFGVLLHTAFWSVAWASIGTLVLLVQSQRGVSWQRNAGSAVGAAIASVPIALVATVVSQLLMTWSAQAALSRSAVHMDTMSSAEFVAAWGLNVRDAQQLKPGTVALTNPLYGSSDVYFSLQEGDAGRVLARWPRTCWQSTAALPAWLFESARELVPAPHDNAPDFMFTRDSLDSLVVLGVRLSERGPSAAPPRWARTFGEARTGLGAGELSWEWFALEVQTTPGSNALHVRQRGHARDMRDWRPICESDGTGIDAFHRRPVIYGTLSGRVESDQDPKLDGRRHRIAGARLLLAHEDGSVREQVETADDGSYLVRLPVGRYRVTITHPDYQALDPGLGYTIISAQPHFARYFLKAR